MLSERATIEICLQESVGGIWGSKSEERVKSYICAFVFKSLDNIKTKSRPPKKRNRLNVKIQCIAKQLGLKLNLRYVMSILLEVLVFQIQHKFCQEKYFWCSHFSHGFKKRPLMFITMAKY